MIDDKDISRIKESFESTSASVVAPKNGWENIAQKLETDKFDKKIKESFSKVEQQTAPFSSLAMLMDEIDNPLDSIVNKSFNQYTVNAPAGLWNKIDSRLETDRVWKNIQDQVKVKPQKWKSGLTAAAIALLLMLIPGLLKDSIQLNEVSFDTSLSVNVEPRNFQSFELLSHNVRPNQTESGVFIPDFQKPNTELNFLSEVEMNENNGLSKLEIPVINSIQTRKFDLESPKIELVKKKVREKKFSIGLITGINRTWVIDNETRASFESNSLIESKLILGTMIGLQAQYDFGKRSLISMNYIINSTSRNKLGKYNNGVYEHKVSEIKLSQISLMYGMHFNLGKIDNGWSLLSKVGPYAGLIRSSLVKEGGIITSFNDGYKSLDYGLNVQIAPTFEIQNFVIETGLNYELGMRNIFAGNSFISSNLNYTNNTDLGVYFSVRYKIK